MGFFIKGLQQQFVLSYEDTEYLLGKIRENYLLFLAYANSESEKEPITSIDDILLNRNNIPQYFIVNKEMLDSIIWNKITLKNGGIKYSIDPLYSRAIQLLLSLSNDHRISVGRISVCTFWKTDNGDLIKTTIEKNSYYQIKRTIKQICVGSIYSRVWVGKNAFNHWSNNELRLAYDLNNPDEYIFSDFKSF